MGYSEKNIAGIFHNRAEKYQFEPFLQIQEAGQIYGHQLERDAEAGHECRPGPYLARR